MSLKGKTLFITGASRGIGLAIALKAARDGANITVAAKTETPHPKLPGTIHTAAAEIEQSDRFGRAAREFRLEERVTEAVNSLSEKQTEQAQKAARRVATYLVGGILMLFLLSWGPRMGQGALDQR